MRLHLLTLFLSALFVTSCTVVVSERAACDEEENFCPEGSLCVDGRCVEGGDGDADSDVDGDIDGDGDADSDNDADADGDLDVPEDADPDTDVDIDSARTTINGIEGTGAAEDVAPRPEDVAALDEYEDRFDAARRISSATPVLVISGSNLDAVTSVEAEGLAGQGTLELAVVAQTESELRLEIAGGATESGLYQLTFRVPPTDVTARIHLLRGRDGNDCAAPLDCDDDGCSLAGNLSVEGGVSVTGSFSQSGAVELGELAWESLSVTRSVWLPECPRGYSRDDSRHDIVLCRRDLGEDRYDEMVKVGDQWVDRYEASVWFNDDCTPPDYGGLRDNWGTVAGTFPVNGTFTRPLYACSLQGVTPSRWLTWFQAQAACRAAGKHLITNAEWQTAAAGTHDPGASPAERGTCLTLSVGPRATGNAGAAPAGTDSCISFWGVEDMVGNVSEWTADWWGQGEDATEGIQSETYGQDMWVNVDAAEVQADPEDHFLAAGIRGGSWSSGTEAGVFALDLEHAPSVESEAVGFRCARGF